MANLRELIFDFFHRFSRFEFALKEADYLKSHSAGARADPSWDCFVERWQEAYRVSDAARALIAANPKQQLVAQDGHSLEFKEVQFGDQVTELTRVVRLTKTVRNNLFHGGKSDSGGWDNPSRIKELVSLGSKGPRRACGLRRAEERLCGLLLRRTIGSNGDLED